jgi:hydroxyethylthiazole kinase-like uncharacterized protein yjeF
VPDDTRARRPNGTDDADGGDSADRTDEPVLVTPDLLRRWGLPGPGGDKEDKGRLLVVGGGESTPGAVLLAAEAALRSGAGKVQVVTTAATAPHLATALPEGLVVGLPARDGEIAPSAADRVLELADGADAVLAGPGLGDPDAAVALLEALVPDLDTVLALDALGTAFVTAHPDGLRHLADRALVTVNATELAAVLGEDPDTVGADQLGATRRATRRLGVAVLSGAEVSYAVAASGRAWRIEAGASGAAVAGSGDVKAGAVAALLAQGEQPVRAAAIGAYLHGRTGEVLTGTVGQVGILAREVATALPRTLAELRAAGP